MPMHSAMRISPRWAKYCAVRWRTASSIGNLSPSYPRRRLTDWSRSKGRCPQYATSVRQCSQPTCLCWPPVCRTWASYRAALAQCLSPQTPLLWATQCLPYRVYAWLHHGLDKGRHWALWRHSTHSPPVTLQAKRRHWHSRVCGCPCRGLRHETAFHDVAIERVSCRRHVWLSAHCPQHTCWYRHDKSSECCALYGLPC